MKAEDAAMIVAAYADCRAYRSEAMGIVRITCELPVEYEAEVHRRLGYPGKGKALILSLANPDQVKAYGPPPDAKAAPAKPKRERERKLSERLDAKARSPYFWQFMETQGYSVCSYDVAVIAQREFCDVKSRAECDVERSPAQINAQALLDYYDGWLTEQRHADNLSRG